MNKQPEKSKPSVGGQAFPNWDKAIEHATMLKMHGKISQRELNDIKTEAREAGHEC